MTVAVLSLENHDKNELKIQNSPSWAANCIPAWYSCFVHMNFIPLTFLTKWTAHIPPSYTQPPLAHHSPEALMFYPTAIYNQLIQHNFTHTNSQRSECKGLSYASVKSTSDMATLVKFSHTKLSYEFQSDSTPPPLLTHREEKRRGVLDVSIISQLYLNRINHNE